MTKEAISKLNKYAYYLVIAVASSLFTFIINVREQERTGYQDLLDRYQLQVTQLEDRLDKLEEENLQLMARVEVLSQTQFNAPIPSWIKGVDGRMITLNPAYEKAFLRPYGKTISDYVGKTDKEFWTELGLPEQGKIYWEVDLEVLTTKKVQRSIKEVNIQGVKKEIIVYNYPYYSTAFGSSPSEVVGIAGICVFR